MLESHRICCFGGNKGFLTTICDANLFGMTDLLENSVKECVVRTSLARTLVVTAKYLAKRRSSLPGLCRTDCVARSSLAMTVLLENSVKECVVRTSLARTLVVTARHLVEQRRCLTGLWMTDCIARTSLVMTDLLKKRVCLESGDGNPTS